MPFVHHRDTMAANSDSRNRSENDPMLEACDWDDGVALQEEGQVEAEQLNPELQESGAVEEASVLEESGIASNAMGPDALETAVRQNTELLARLVAQLASSDLPSHRGSDEVVDSLDVANDDAIEAVDENIRLRSEVEELHERIEDLQRDLEILREQNRELASKVAHEDVVRSASDGSEVSNELNWEERKRLILEQFENDSYDAEAFISSLRSDANGKQDEPLEVGADEFESPEEYVKSLNAELARRGELIRHYEEEAHQSDLEKEQDREAAEVRIASALDADEAVVEEREKLRQLQGVWETRFRESEIAASLERAKMSRERREMQQLNKQLQEQVEMLNAQLEMKDHNGEGTGSRWMAKLGLSGQE